eukprot:COSAG06_NODE_11948_length_1443_cov_1.226935_1_plen_343_part_10
MEPEPEPEAEAARLARVAKLEAELTDDSSDGLAALSLAEGVRAALLEAEWPEAAGGTPLPTEEAEADATELYNSGVDCQDDEDHAQAIRCFTAALLQGHDSDTLVARGNSLLETEQWAAAVADYTAALRGEPLDFFRHATQRLVELGALTADGIFRLAGSNDAVSEMMEQLRAGQPPREILAACEEVNDVATFLGRWLREQPMLIPVSHFAKCDELLATADFVSINSLLDDSSRHLIGKVELAKMKKGSYLINVARGPLVDEDALVEALESGHLAGAGLDVYEYEPPEAKPATDDEPGTIGPGKALREAPNVFLQPHSGSATTRARQEMQYLCMRNIKAALVE